MINSFDKGKSIHDASKDIRTASPSRKTADFIRLSTQSTRENPRLLGGTNEEGAAYKNALSKDDTAALAAYRSYLSRLQTRGTPKATDVAKAEFPRGHTIYCEYQREAHRPAQDQGEGSSKRKKNKVDKLTDQLMQDPVYRDKIQQQARELQGID